MNPADEAQAFAALVAGGATVEDVARHTSRQPRELHRSLAQASEG
jgi:hypothetical protein